MLSSGSPQGLPGQEARPRSVLPRSRGQRRPPLPHRHHPAQGSPVSQCPPPICSTSVLYRRGTLPGHHTVKPHMGLAGQAWALPRALQPAGHLGAVRPRQRGSLASVTWDWRKQESLGNGLQSFTRHQPVAGLWKKLTISAEDKDRVPAEDRMLLQLQRHPWHAPAVGRCPADTQPPPHCSTHFLPQWQDTTHSWLVRPPSALSPAMLQERSHAAPASVISQPPPPRLW